MPSPFLPLFRALYAGFSIDLLFRYTALFLLNPISASRHRSAPVSTLPASLLIENVYAWGRFNDDVPPDTFF